MTTYSRDKVLAALTDDEYDRYWKCQAIIDGFWRAIGTGSRSGRIPNWVTSEMRSNYDRAMAERQSLQSKGCVRIRSNERRKHTRIAESNQTAGEVGQTQQRTTRRCKRRNVGTHQADATST